MNFRQKVKNAIGNFEKVGIFGFPYLDETLEGVFSSDLIVIGARSGAGKSSLASIIAAANKNCNVALFSIENFEGDEYLKHLYYQYKKVDFSYKGSQRHFNANYKNLDQRLIDKAIDRVENKIGHIHLYSRQKNYTLEKLKEDMIETVTKNNTKLIILDHLDYLEKENPNESDIKHISDLMRIIRDFQDAFNCAIIALSHLRKVDKRYIGAIPSMDEFIGSSNKIKEATVVVTLAPDEEANIKNPFSTLKSTWCCIRKLRAGGVNNTVARTVFDISQDSYRGNYTLCTVNFDGTKIEEINNYV